METTTAGQQDHPGRASAAPTAHAEHHTEPSASPTARRRIVAEEPALSIKDLIKEFKPSRAFRTKYPERLTASGLMYTDPYPVEELAERLGIDAFNGTTIRRLSGGQKQRVSLAAALIGRPDVLFLDEPSAGLDPQSRNVVFDIIREQRELGTAIVLTTHLIDDAQKLADYVYIIENGATVQEGTVSELIASDGTNRLQYTLDAPTPTREQLLPAHLRAGVELIEKVPYTPARDGAPSVPGAYELVGALRPEHLAAFTSALAERYLMPISLTMEPKTLEDVFLDISGRDIR